MGFPNFFISPGINHSPVENDAGDVLSDEKHNTEDGGDSGDLVNGDSKADGQDSNNDASDEAASVNVEPSSNDESDDSESSNDGESSSDEGLSSDEESDNEESSSDGESSSDEVSSSDGVSGNEESVNEEKSNSDDESDVGESSSDSVSGNGWLLENGERIYGTDLSSFTSDSTGYGTLFPLYDSYEEFMESPVYVTRYEKELLDKLTFLQYAAALLIALIFLLIFKRK